MRKNKNELIIVKNGEVFTTSLIIANGTDNEHQSVKKLIKTYENDFKDFGRVWISNRTLETKGGKQDISVYFLNEPQATFLITLLRNNKIVVAFKKELVKQFYNMKQVLMQRNTIEWKEARAIGKEARRELTDTIRDYLIPLAIEQGSTNYNRYYKIYSDLADATSGIFNRDFATSEQLNNLKIIENIIKNVILIGAREKRYYKDIYQDCKFRLKQFKEIAFLE